MGTVVTGFHAIEEALRAGAPAERLVVSGKGRRIEELSRRARSGSVRVVHERAEVLDRLCGHSDHRGAVLLLESSPGREAASVRACGDLLRAEECLVVVLDGITDPHNLGAIMRSADQFGVDLLVIPRRRAAGETETVGRVSSGANAYVPLVVAANLSTELGELKKLGFWVYGAAAGGKSAQRLDLRGRTALVLGSEGRGLGRLVRERCDELIAIPSRGHVDSFNVSVAAGILMYEVRRQQWG